MEKIEIEKMSKIKKVLRTMVLFMTRNCLYIFLYKIFLCPNHILMFIMER